MQNNEENRRVEHDRRGLSDDEVQRIAAAFVQELNKEDSKAGEAFAVKVADASFTKFQQAIGRSVVKNFFLIVLILAIGVTAWWQLYVAPYVHTEVPK